MIDFFLTFFFASVWHAQNFPFLSQELFYENGTLYDQTLILNADFSLDKAALAEQGLPWFTPSNVMYLIGSNLAIGATLTHVLVWFGKPIMDSIKEYRAGTASDPHREKMAVYDEVPMWWYWFILAGSFAMAMACLYTGHSGLPWWGLIVALILSVICVPFVVTVYAVTGFNTDTSQLAQMLGAALIPGKPQANMYFTMYGSNTVLQARGLIRDLKMGQYTKLPPRVTFNVQVIGTIVGALLNYVMMKVIIDAQREVLLSVEGTNVWSGQQVQSFNSNAISWGALGEVMYGPGSPYFVSLAHTPSPFGF